MNKSTEVIIQATYPLSGTLTIPDESNPIFPAILLISGLGNADRDGNLKKMKMNLYKDVAEFLTSKGFITLRYDKRGTHQSGGIYLETGLTDFTEMVKGEAEGHVIPDMNHILRNYDGQHTMLGLLKEYKTQLCQPIDSELFDKMGTWLQKYYWAIRKQNSIY